MDGCRDAAGLNVGDSVGLQATAGPNSVQPCSTDQGSVMLREITQRVENARSERWLRPEAHLREGLVVLPEILVSVCYMLYYVGTVRDRQRTLRLCFNGSSPAHRLSGGLYELFMLHSTMFICCFLL
ncbi:hypothetical protein CEXT_198511 [Caerostris extrusa]|uniref:Uncharacterized protein n=1 Tax=Caerostris extrusa TaxID=172846 RepID=A0AAV4XTI3_CAEEX|nr:hypothetical protein CEXT_198511 [Caerostris extrusa]